MISKKQYIEYLLTTPINYTCSNLSEHLENVSHDTVTDFLQNSKFTPRDLWELVKDRIADSEEAFLLVDDSVQNKEYSHAIETVKLQPCVQLRNQPKELTEVLCCRFADSKRLRPYGLISCERFDFDSAISL